MTALNPVYIIEIGFNTSEATSLRTNAEDLVDGSLHFHCLTSSRSPGALNRLKLTSNSAKWASSAALQYHAPTAPARSSWQKQTLLSLIRHDNQNPVKHLTYKITTMERIRNALKQRHSPAYEPLNDDSDSNGPQRARKPRFSWLEYSIFLLLGVSMLWAW